MSLRLVLAALLLAGCSGYKGMETPDPSSLSFFTAGDGTLNPSSDKLSSDCVTNKDFDACIFKKNPVAQENGAVSDLNSVRKFGVKLRGLATTGFLENPKLKVLTLSTPRASMLDMSKFKSQITDDTSYVEQISAYYYGNLAMEYLEKQVGADRLPGGTMKLYVDDAFTGFSSSNSSIHFEKKSSRPSKALSGEIVVQLIGQSIASRLSDKKIHSSTTAQHKSCELEAKGCCSTTMGCSQALLNGFGDYMSAMIFPASAKLGETVSGSAQGQSVCSVRRDLALLSTKTKTQVFAACPSQGYAVLMGTWYAAIWWKMRNQLEAQEAGSAQDIDKLFFDHARAWTGGFTFTDAKVEALRLSALYKNGKYTSAMASAFQSAGI
jgi:hypothetical protein